jgi:hypothetical protein
VHHGTCQSTHIIIQQNSCRVKESTAEYENFRNMRTQAHTKLLCVLQIHVITVHVITGLSIAAVPIVRLYNRGKLFVLKCAPVGAPSQFRSFFPLASCFPPLWLTVGALKT